MAVDPYVEGHDENDPETSTIIGAVFEVYKQIGHGFLEAVDQEALGIELLERLIPFRREVDVPVL